MPLFAHYVDNGTRPYRSLALNLYHVFLVLTPTSLPTNSILSLVTNICENIPKELPPMLS
uniref:Uncharacterized protein n=1 Tax=Picea glauca TaxID=3330 RepID=A0A101M2E1_PICGL|nr:hypothetical protein ABT39_MTgene2936 [Picea glauca]